MSLLGVTVPDLEPAVRSYGDTILSHISGAIGPVLIYGAAFLMCAIVIGLIYKFVGMAHPQKPYTEDDYERDKLKQR